MAQKRRGSYQLGAQSSSVLRAVRLSSNLCVGTRRQEPGGSASPLKTGHSDFMRDGAGGVNRSALQWSGLVREDIESYRRYNGLMGACVPNLAQESFDRTRYLLNERLSLAHPRADLGPVKRDDIRIVALLPSIEEAAIEPSHVFGKSLRDDPVLVEECADATVLWRRISFSQQEGRDRIEAGIVEAIHRSAHVVACEKEHCLGYRLPGRASLYRTNSTASGVI